MKTTPCLLQMIHYQATTSRYFMSHSALLKIIKVFLSNLLVAPGVANYIFSHIPAPLPPLPQNLSHLHTEIFLH
jgi:hypothetical protein